MAQTLWWLESGLGLGFRVRVSEPQHTAAGLDAHPHLQRVLATTRRVHPPRGGLEVLLVRLRVRVGASVRVRVGARVSVRVGLCPTRRAQGSPGHQGRPGRRARHRVEAASSPG